jgi:thioredoxin-related protein
MTAAMPRTMTKEIMCTENVNPNFTIVNMNDSLFFNVKYQIMVLHHYSCTFCSSGKTFKHRKFNAGITDPE